MTNATPIRYYCLYCMRLLVSNHGVFVHDDVPHDPLSTYDEEGSPQ